MGLDDALSLLELTRDASSKEARRAYLRQVRRHPPERDPEGFRKVREAYEFVQPLLALPDEARQSLVPGHDEPPDAASDQEEVGDDDWPVESWPAVELPEASPSDLVPPFPYEGTLARQFQWVDDAFAGLLASFTSASDDSKPTWLAGMGLALLLQRQDWKRAQLLRDQVDRWQMESAGLRDVLRGPLAARWALLSELTTSGPKLPAPVVEALARGIGDDDQNSITLGLTDFARQSPDEARQAMFMARYHAPQLHTILEDHFDPKRPSLMQLWRAWRQHPREPQPRTIGRGWSQLRLKAFALSLAALIHFMIVGTRRHEASTAGPASTISSAANAPARLPPPFLSTKVEAKAATSGAAAPNRPNYDAVVVTQARDALHHLVRQLGLGELEDQNQRVYQAFPTHSCPRLVAEFEKLEHMTQGMVLPIRAQVQRYWAEVLIYCPEDSQVKQD